MGVGVDVGVIEGVSVGAGAGIVVGVDMAGLVVHYSTSAHDK